MMNANQDTANHPNDVYANAPGFSEAVRDTKDIARDVATTAADSVAEAAQDVKASLEAPSLEDAYREMSQLSAHVVKIVMDLLVTNPMMKGMLGPQFEEEARHVGGRLETLLRTVNPDYPGA